ncbi:MAG TPA: hypothetical protein VFU37_09955 [Pyrinomonadaceae bacterium]|nr:hypothetical protein [Pyrinomonadaceae bacterium]
MTFVRKLEVSGGIATLVLGLAAPFSRNSFPDRVGDSWTSAGFLLDLLVLFVIPGLLVAFGSFVHSVRRKKWGLVLLLIGGAFLTLMMFIHAFGGTFYVWGLWSAVLIVLQALTAILTVILSATPGTSVTSG